MVTPCLQQAHATAEATEKLLQECRLELWQTEQAASRKESRHKEEMTRQRGLLQDAQGAGESREKMMYEIVRSQARHQADAAVLRDELYHTQELCTDLEERLCRYGDQGEDEEASSPGGGGNGVPFLSHIHPVPPHFHPV